MYSFTRNGRASHYQSNVFVCVSNNHMDVVNQLLILKGDLRKVKVLFSFPKRSPFNYHRPSYSNILHRDVPVNLSKFLFPSGRCHLTHLSKQHMDFTGIPPLGKRIH